MIEAIPHVIPNLLEEDWRENALVRLPAIFPNQGARDLAALCTLTHRFAIDYLDQAPAVLAYVGWGAVPRTRTDRAYIAQRFGSAASRGLKLRDFLAEFSAPLPIRKLRSVAICPSYFPAIVDLRRLELSDLAQAIPDTPVAQAKWLRVMRDWHSYEQRYGGSDSAVKLRDLYRWAAMTFGREAQEGFGAHHTVRDIVDFVFSNPPGSLNPRWTMGAALAAVDRWHGELGKRRDEEVFLAANGIGFEDPIDYGHLPDRRAVASFEFVALRSGLDLFTEGAAMRHCVSTYSRKVVAGQSFIYSIRHGERRVATLEVAPQQPNNRHAFKTVQLVGPCNADPKKEIKLAALLFVQRENLRLADEWRAERDARRKAPKDMKWWTGGAGDG
ncbi:hypothetical protein C3941_25355 [Kaistia algarum]|uniref:PcfJ domain-containing protein n=1 Tax=Kaistia algarum TaxID=2083279 RepID=UPI000CE7AEF0|nr:PcfJ domain-containing protein [Kaistia algarum]MCX5516258.1 PcfJ domain-containing protein [Kaistia algarum]PPE77118.1 hypothetical protein C3941_25355 [Kaistia algarum]